MFWTLLTIGVLLAWMGFHLLRYYFYIYKHLEEADLYEYQYGRIPRGTRRYQHIITHLSTCELCQEQLRVIQAGKSIEDHLIDEDS